MGTYCLASFLNDVHIMNDAYHITRLNTESTSKVRTDQCLAGHAHVAIIKNWYITLSNLITIASLVSEEKKRFSEVELRLSRDSVIACCYANTSLIRPWTFISKVFLHYREKEQRWPRHSGCFFLTSNCFHPTFCRVLVAKSVFPEDEWHPVTGVQRLPPWKCF